MKTWLCVYLLLLGCQQEDAEMRTLSGSTMGTYYIVKYVDESMVLESEAHSAIKHVLEVAHQEMSTYRPLSEISQWNQSTHGGVVSPWFFEVADFSLKLSHWSQGFYDPTVAPLVDAWGFGPSQRGKEPTKTELSQLLQNVGAAKVQTESRRGSLKKKYRGVKIDLSSTAKGSAVDKVSEALRAMGLVNHLVDIGGEIKASGYKAEGHPWVIGVEKPIVSTQRTQLQLPLLNMSIATSGNYRNFYESGGHIRHHTMNPHTGLPVEADFASVTVLAASCMHADGYATALMAMPQDVAFQYADKQNIAAFFIHKDGKFASTRAFTKYEEGLL